MTLVIWPGGGSMMYAGRINALPGQGVTRMAYHFQSATISHRLSGSRAAQLTGALAMLSRVKAVPGFAFTGRHLALFALFLFLITFASPVVSQSDGAADDVADDVALDKHLSLQIEAPKDDLTWGDEILVRLTAANAGAADIEAVALNLHDQPGIAWSDDFKGQWLELGDMAAGESRVIEGRVRVEGLPDSGTLSLFATLQGHDVEPAEASVALSVPGRKAEELTVSKRGSLVEAADSRVQFTFPDGWNESDARLTFHLREQFRQEKGDSGRLLLFTVEAATADDNLVETFDKPIEVTVNLSDLVALEWSAANPPVVSTRRNEKENWTAVESKFDPETGVLSFSASHFSSYQVTTEPEIWKLLYNPPGASAYTGAATYQYPIDLPPGIGGLTPDLSLNYSSRPAEGMRKPAMGSGFGVGWSLPQAQINNGNTGKMYDFNGGASDFQNYNFTLVLNGVTYYLKKLETYDNRSHGSYQAVGGPDLRIEYLDDGYQGKPENDTGNVTGEFWRVRTADGTTYTFGFTEGAEQVIWPVNTLPFRNGNQPRNKSFSAYNWKLDSVTDVHGNRIEYVYDTACGVEWVGGGNRQGNLEGGGGKECTEVDTAVKEIHYNFNGATAQTKILFTNEQMNFNQRRQEKSMTAGVFRPTEIKVMQGGTTTITRYAFIYSTAAHYHSPWDISTEYWTLTSLSRTGAGGAGALPAQTFGYNRETGTCQDGACVKLLTHVNNGYGAVTVMNYTNIIGTRWNYVSKVETWDGVAAKYGTDPQPQSRRMYVPGVVPDSDPNTSMFCYDKPWHATDNPCNSRVVPGEGSEALIGFDAMTIETWAPSDSSWMAKETQIFYNNDYWLLGKLNERRQFDGGGVLMKDTYSWGVVSNGEFVQTRLNEESHTLAPFGTTLASSITYTYEALDPNNPNGGSYGALKSRQEKDEAGAAFRCTKYAYAHRTNDAWLVNRIAQETVKSGGCGGTTLAETRYRYAESANVNSVGLDKRALLTYVLRWAGGNNYIVEKSTYTAQGLLEKAITYKDHITGSAYPGDGNIRHTTTTTYNTLGVPTSVTTADGATTIGYNATFPWLVGSVKDPNLLTTQYDYDNFGRLSMVAMPGDSLTTSGATMRYDYYDDRAPYFTSPLLVGVFYKDNIKSAERRFYDGLGRPVQSHTALAEVDGADKDIVATTAYDARGLAVCATVPYAVAPYVYNQNNPVTPFNTDKCNAKPRTSMSYDYLGRLTNATTPDGAQTRTQYGVAADTNVDNITVDNHSRFLRTTTFDGNNHVVNRYSDVFGRLVLAREFTGNSGATYAAYADTRYSYDVMGNLTAVKKSEASNPQPGNFLWQTTMSYDAVGRKTGMTDPDMREWAYIYGGDGNLARQEHRSGATAYHATCFYYDNLNRLLHRANDASPGDACPASAPLTGADHLAGYVYGTSEDNNNVGRLVEVNWGAVPANNKDTFAYEVDDANGNSEGRLFKQTRTVNGRTFEQTVTAYDALDRPTKVKLPSGEVVVTGYDEEGVNTLKAGSTTLISGVGYNERGQLTSLGRPGSAPATTLGYHGANKNFRLSAITTGGSSALPDFAYNSYDLVGNLTNFTAGGDNYQYTYDEFNRLDTVSGAVARNYDYDRLGNFDLVTVNGQARDYAYAYGKPMRLMSVSNLPLTVDSAAGYDTWGNMRKYNLRGVVHELNFNNENRLASVKVGAAQPTVFAYDADGQRVMTTQPDGTIVYTPFPDYEVTDPPTGADTVRTTYRLGGRIVAVQTKVGAAAGVFYFTYTDHLGNISAMSTTAGVYVADSRAWYDPFGAFISDPTVNPPDVNPVPSSNPAISNHGFTGHRHNNTGTNNLGLIYMNARYYMPEIGRFISPDTIVPDPTNPQSYNRYSYVLNLPMNYTDPTGHRPASGCEYENCGLGASSNNYLWQQSDGQLAPWDPTLIEPRYDAVTFGSSADVGGGVLGPLGIKGAVGFQVLYNTQSHELTSFLNYSSSASNTGAIGNFSFYIGGVSKLGESNYAYRGSARSVSGTGSAGLLGLTTGISVELGDNPFNPQGTFTEYIGWAPGMGASLAVSDSYSIPIFTNNLETGESSWDIMTYINEGWQAQFDYYSNAWATFTSWFGN